MPEVEIAINGVRIKIVDGYGDVAEMTEAALVLAGKVQEQWRAINLAEYRTPAPMADPNATI